MSQIYATYIRADQRLISYLGVQNANEHTTIVINIYHFHVLVTMTKKQNHLMSSLNNSFFNELSLFKDKISFVFQYNTNELIPMYVLYSCNNKKIGIVTKKKIIKLFNQVGLVIKEVKTAKNKKEDMTKFSFDY